jgi:hypothetical protein
MFIEWLKGLFKKKPMKLIEIRWGGSGVMPDGGSFFMPLGDIGKVTYDGSIPGLYRIPVDCQGGKLTVAIDPAPKGGASVLLYKYLQDGKIWIPGWCPSVDFAPGCTSMELDLSAYAFSPGESITAWGGYAVGLEANQGPIDIKATVTLYKR